MILPIVPNHFYQVIIKLLAVLDLPVIISLINRNDKTLVRTFHVFYKLCLRALHRNPFFLFLYFFQVPHRLSGGLCIFDL